MEIHSRTLNQVVIKVLRLKKLTIRKALVVESFPMSLSTLMNGAEGSIKNHRLM